MPNQASLWQRLSGLFRPAAPVPPGNGHVPPAVPPTGDGQTLVVEEPRGGTGPAGGSRALSWWPRREPTVAQMRDGYQRVLETMDALQEHFRQQEQRSLELGQSVRRMVGTLEQLSESGRSQQEHLGTLSEHVSAASRHAAAMSDALSQLPATLRMQAEALRTLLRKIEISQESDAQLMHSLQQLTRAVEGLSASGAAQVRTLERLDADQREQREVLTLLVREQGRRFLLVLVVAAFIGLGALGILLAMYLGRAG